ncbi:Protein kinase domain-containing protein [Metarhizium album ARSEF 1941]|uniref:Protein kinase domain-containing protein n=1 Tax=Metarhizium album (strain ARSEF 1941) TaxID=1081103 RepID=A0A0B2WJV5_METAS|nr:Protein kinase domain-containing protein [Metarhizium album ARSEF 1941]KHN94218.1 Protein kinase domain-containing protein [Metarhizium album ARSEF 1941]
MAGLDGSESEPPPATSGGWDLLLRHFGPTTDETMLLASKPDQILNAEMEGEHLKNVESGAQQDSRGNVTGLPRSQTLKRRLSEQRVNLEPLFPDERRAASENRRRLQSNKEQATMPDFYPRSTLPGPLSSSSSLDGYDSENTSYMPSDLGHYELSNHTVDHARFDSESRYDDAAPSDVHSTEDAGSIADSQEEATIAEELTQKWILNLSRLHIHVVEDGNEIIHFPTSDQVRHLECKFVRERDVDFDSHLSGFVYKVRVNGQTLIKKEIPSPDTVDEFLYEVNVLGTLRDSPDIVRLCGLVIDDDDQIKGLLLTYAEQGSLMDVIYDKSKEQGIPWLTRQKWARQIIRGLRDIHESGFVQGDLTLNNIVVNAADDAKIIDINRRGCPAGWEPPELKMLLESDHHLSLFIGVKSDLFQLGMVLWALAMLDDDPESRGRPLMLGPEIDVPDWYRQMTEMCLDADPKKRLAPSALLRLFPPDIERRDRPAVATDETSSLDEYSIHYSSQTEPHIETVPPSHSWQRSGNTYADSSLDMYEPRYPMRGPSPPGSPRRSSYGYDSIGRVCSNTSWAANKDVPASYSDIDKGAPLTEQVVNTKLRPETPLSLGQYDIDKAAFLPGDALDTIGLKRATVPTLDRNPSLGDGLQTISTPKLTRQETVVRDPTRQDTAKTGQFEGTSKMEDKDLAVPLHERIDEPTDDMKNTTEMVNIHGVVDTHEIRPMGSDMDDGVLLEGPGCAPTTHGLFLQRELHSEDQGDIQQNERPADVVAMQISADMVELTMNTERERSADSVTSSKLQPHSVYKPLEEPLSRGFLKRSSILDAMPESHIRQRPASLPAVLTGISAGVPAGCDTIEVRNMINHGNDSDAAARPATV